MESSLQHFLGSTLGLCVLIFVGMLGRLLFSWWVVPNLAYKKLKANGFSGPKPSFPVGNLNDMKKKKTTTNSGPSSTFAGISNDIHSTAFPYFARWQNCMDN
ncbi:hypothetical protein ACS0TY_030770 [Phlomoides rotata]